MKFDVYCDECRPDLLGSKNPQARYMVIGSLWLETANRQKFKVKIHELRNQHKIGGEFKWQKISPSRIDFYKELISWFISVGEQLRFRCIAVDRRQVDLKLYHQDDQELGFYKFYYQLLHHWVLDCNQYSIFVDLKNNRQSDRLPILKKCLDRANLSSQIIQLQSQRSEEVVLIQLADVLTGLASYRLNNIINTHSAKHQFLEHAEYQLGQAIGPTSKSKQKFNVFQINLDGGW